MKKVAVNTVKNFIKAQPKTETWAHTYEMGEWSMAVECKTQLTLQEKSVFLNRVLSGCFDVLQNYRPEYFEPMLHVAILQMCTNLPAISLRGERDANGGELIDMESMEALYQALDFLHVFGDQYGEWYEETKRLCEEAVDWRKQRVLAADQSMSALNDAARSVEEAAKAITEKVNNLDTESLMEYAGKLSKATEGLDDGGILHGLLEMHKEGKLVELPKN